MSRIGFRSKLLVLSILLVAGCSKPETNTPTPLPTPGLLNKTAVYWDMGLSITYPSNWLVPNYTLGQMILSASADSTTDQLPTQPLIGVRLIDPVNDPVIPKDATLQQLAAFLIKGRGITINGSGATNVGGLDAAYVNVQNTDINFSGQSIAFRLTDGRIGGLVAIAPQAVWADFAPTFDKMRASAQLIKPADYGQIPALDATSDFPQGGLTFMNPKSWLGQILTDNFRYIHPTDASEYTDNSGYVNGPQLSFAAQAFPANGNLAAELQKLVNAAGDLKIESAVVGGQPAVQIKQIEPETWQAVDYVAVLSRDKTVMIVMRWTVPGILADAFQPTLTGILQSVKFSAISATLVPVPTAQVTPQPGAPQTGPQVAPQVVPSGLGAVAGSAEQGAEKGATAVATAAPTASR